MTLAPAGLGVPVVLGAPGVVFLPDVAPRVLVGVRMDVAAFVGVAPRGPAWEIADPHEWPYPDGTARTRSVPVMVESWDDYTQTFGSFEGPSLLPYAVATFFQQGGQRAQVVRIVHDEAGVTDGAVDPPGRASYAIPGTLPTVDGSSALVVTRNEGSWGGLLTATLSFATSPLVCLGSGPQTLVLDLQAEVTVGAYLRLVLAGGTRVFRTVTGLTTGPSSSGSGFELVATLDTPVTAPVWVERVDTTLDVVDRDPLRARSEHFVGLGLLPDHPNWIGSALQQSSNLVELQGAANGFLLTDIALAPIPLTLSAPGFDRYSAVVPGDFFGTLLENDDSATDGLDVLLRVPEVASIVVPDLYSPAPLAPLPDITDPPSLAGPDFGPCVEPPPPSPMTTPPPGLDGLRLNPLDSNDLTTIIGLQNTVVSYAENLDAVALLDTPPGLTQRSILQWRASFDSSFGAGYHPWIVAPIGSPTAPLVTANPSAFAAGVIARTELVYGVPHGPADQLLFGAVDVSDDVDPTRQATLHQNNVDVSVQRTNGIWLMGARTLSRDPTWRQLSVRRIVSMVERTITSELAWTVFEPNDRALRNRLELLLKGLLTQLFAQGAFAGATPGESFFVRTATDAQLPAETDVGELICQIGLAVAEPLEFILVTIARDASGALTAETFGD